MANLKALSFHYEQLKYGTLELFIPTLSADGFTLRGSELALTPPWQAPVLLSLNSVWNIEQFKIARQPWRICPMPFSPLKVPMVLDLPIKFPGTEYRVPKELCQLMPILQRIVNIEGTINPVFEQAYAYLTVDTRPVTRGSSQRNGSKPCAHVDGFQGRRILPTTIEHHYILTSSLPTEYHFQSFNVDHFDAEENFFDFLNKQVKPDSVITHAPFELLMTDSYTVHSASVAAVDQERNFLRLSFGERIFDRLGNSHNPMFTYNWQMTERCFQPLHKW